MKQKEDAIAIEHVQDSLESVEPISAFITDEEDNGIPKYKLDADNVPVIVLPRIVPFQFLSLPLPLPNNFAKEQCERALAEKKMVCLATSRTPDEEAIFSAEDLYPVGVVAQVMKVIDFPDGTATAFVATYQRAEILELLENGVAPKARVKILKDSVPAANSKETAALISQAVDLFQEFTRMVGEEDTRELHFAFQQIEDPLRKINFICTNAPVEVGLKAQMLETGPFKKRVTMLIRHLSMSTELLKMKISIQQKTQANLSQQQKENFLQNQIRTIQEELGYTDEDDFYKLKVRAEAKKWQPEVMEYFQKELRKLQRFNSSSPDYNVLYSYLDSFLNLPWNECPEQHITLERVGKILDEDHYGLDNVKDRIIEHMAVLSLRGDLKAPIICLVGPPGVGKTSLGRSIARALGRKYARVSLGGLHDEAEIRGHRRTYIGAMPGRILTALSKCGTSNPVFVLDEIDKIGQDFKGDPAQALLEVLDPEQNSKFHDNYIDYDYDLSKVLFIATANSTSTISQPLLDRMEIIEVGGYITSEKQEIARRHLLPKELETNGFKSKEISITPKALTYIIEHYTRESGVRQLEKTISKLLRKLARQKAEGKPFPKQISPSAASQLLGKELVDPDMSESDNTCGVATGLAWTSVGGEILFIESSLSEGKGQLTMTGNLGDVMKESATLAMNYIKSHAKGLGIDSERLQKTDVHIHVPEGAIPKDGPSAGVTLLSSLVSSFTGRVVEGKIAMTGEITLRGKVLPVGGIKEKILAAKRSGISDIILSASNRKDIDEIKPKYLEGLTFHYVKNVEEVLSKALRPQEGQSCQEKEPEILRNRLKTLES